MSSRFAITLVITVAMALPVVAVALPYLRGPTPKPARPPLKPSAGVERRFTAEGLEILVARPLLDPSVTQSRPTAPILLLHGAVGTAMVWNRWLPYLASKGRTVYAVSLSGMSVSLTIVSGELITCLGLLTGHGESPRPHNFACMGLKCLSRDIQAALDYISFNDPSPVEPVLVAHSWGGGLAQYAIANSNPDDEPLVSGLVLLGSVPPFGMRCVLAAWMRLDPWFFPRFLLDMGDLRSPLSTPLLVRRAFFGPHTPQSNVQGFFDLHMNHEESVSWMRDMMLRYVEPQNVKAKIPGGRVLCLGGDRDALVTPDIAKDTAGEYGVDIVSIRGAGELSFMFFFFGLICFTRPSYAERRLMERGG